MATKAKASTDAAQPFVFVDGVPVGRVFLALNNPRFEEVESEAEAIDRLCSKEDVLPLARDIVRHGLSPLERFAMTAIGQTRKGDLTYWVAEGNRRICALKLLSDPDLAPPKFRKSFERLAEDWTPITAVDAAVFNSEDTLRVWLDRVHSGPQGGVGRVTWNPEQKQRFFGGSKNKLAQVVLDYAEAEGMITADERERKLTTAQRFLSPEVFREAIGIDRNNPNELLRTRPKAEFDTMLRRFVRDLVTGEEVTSRSNKPQIIAYARKLSALPGITTGRIEPEPLAPVLASPTKVRVRKTPRKPEPARHVTYEDQIFRALQALGNRKLESLYHSICALELAQHTPIICIGVWAFFESLTAAAGRDGNTNFERYLSKNRLVALGIKGDTVSLRSALSRITEYGNTSKHHPIAVTFNGDQLANDMAALKEVILAVIGSIDATSENDGRG